MPTAVPIRYPERSPRTERFNLLLGIPGFYWLQLIQKYAI